MQFNYNTTVPQGGIGGDFPNQIQALRTAQAPTVAKAAFNAPVYQRARMTPQQQMGMNRNMADQFRTGTWQQANNLQRAYQPADQQMRMQQMASANQAMNSLNDIFTQGMLGDQSNTMKFQQMQPQMLQQNMDFLGPLFSMFGGY